MKPFFALNVLQIANSAVVAFLFVITRGACALNHQVLQPRPPLPELYYSEEMGAVLQYVSLGKACKHNMLAHIPKSNGALVSLSCSSSAAALLSSGGD